MRKIVLSLLFLALVSQLHASKYTLDFYFGFVKNMKEDLTIRQSGHDDILIGDADLKTKPTKMPYYYGIRVAKWNSDETKALELEHVHQKLYLDDLPPEVQRWEVTDGYNFFLLNRVCRDKDMDLLYRYGGGLVITHPDITVRDKSNHKNGNGALVYGEGYHLSGFVFQGSVNKRFEINKKWYFNLEGKLTYAKAWVPIYNGNVEVQNRAAHFNYGFGYKF